jgi:hypothetical protein
VPSSIAWWRENAFVDPSWGALRARNALISKGTDKTWTRREFHKKMPLALSGQSLQAIY